ncbi:MAE_28990/MAE_18760 family HEPN-like nuclease [Aliiroseovarius sp. PrR006]|uniref:MAE_28990/MAE_18760 family HEPN-like nuclease n=1 Tax=Aliiroseovarius sp. PrR006 TaxID=2706883 RepID=UPI0013D0A1BF|nr:hypothetical protein [Aliiroseovarius sp. PrR006]
MAKIRTLSDLQDRLDKELAWRLKEVAVLKTAVQKASGQAQVAQVRAGVTILYAHWEGFVKQASTQYLEYICRSGTKYSELQDAFVFLGLRKQISRIAVSSKTKAGIEAIEFMRKGLGETASFDYQSAIDTASNLSSTVFEDIATSVAIDPKPYTPYSKLIDESLLNRRNKIAHGEFLDLDAKSWKELSDEVLILLRMFKTDIENCATMRSFKLKAVST